MERNYYARELVMFAKYKREMSENGVYMLIGYLNNDKTKFRDISTGGVYNINEVEIAKDGTNTLGSTQESVNNLHQTKAIDVNGDDFVQIGMRIIPHEGGIKFRHMWVSDECVFSKLNAEPFMEIRGKVGYPYLYHFISKWQNSSLGVVSRADITGATKEANSYVSKWLQGWQESDNSVVKQIQKQGYPSLSDEEREF